MNFRQLVIGCGTGRRGTKSLKRLLNRCTGVSMLHEGLTPDRINHLIPWYDGEDQLLSWLARLAEVTGGAKWYGDVGSYFLPYLPTIIARYPRVRIVCLERSKRLVVKSFLRKTRGRNHWYLHDGSKWHLDPKWDAIFPVFAEREKSKAIELYWDYYHAKLLEYRARFADNLVVMPTAALNCAQGRRKMLAFINYVNPYSQIDVELHRKRFHGLAKVRNYFRRFHNYSTVRRAHGDSQHLVAAHRAEVRHHQ